MIASRKTILASSLALTLVATQAEAALVNDVIGPYSWSTDSANFTALTLNGMTLSGSNDVHMQWDGSGYSASSDYTGPGGASNVTLSSTTAFYGHIWTAHDVQIFVPGSYSFDTALGGGNAESGIMNVTVGTGQLGMHLLFDWNGGLNTDMFVVLARNSLFGSGIGRSVAGVTAAGANNCDAGAILNCLWDGPGFGSDGQPAGNKVWSLATVDGNGDGVMGVPTANGGPISGYNFSFNASLAPTVIPVPAAVWLFGSGLLGLLGIARRRVSSA